MADINNRTVDELFDRFEREVIPTLAERTRKDYTWHLRRLRTSFGTRIAGQLLRADIEALLKVPEGTRGTIQRNRATAVLSSVLARAVDWGWVTHNVCSNVRRNPSSKPQRDLTEEEFTGARKLALPRLRAAMDLALLTRQPQINVLTLRWSQVHDHVILFRDKGKRKVEVEITPEIRKVLEECRALSDSSDYVISKTEGWGGGRYTSEGFRAIWMRLMKEWEETGNDRFTFHDIRELGERRHKEREARKAEAARAVADYPQFERALCEEAGVMAEYYQVFYCLEQKIRQLIVRRLTDALGAAWWDAERVPQETKVAATKLRQREVESGITPRSGNMIDYTSFGELSGIITNNWDIFETAFYNKAAVGRVMHQLNLLRGPIAHSCPMTDDEIHRLGIAVKDWFRQVRGN